MDNVGPLNNPSAAFESKLKFESKACGPGKMFEYLAKFVMQICTLLTMFQWVSDVCLDWNENNDCSHFSSFC